MKEIRTKIVETPFGYAAGESIDGITRFLGIPNAAPPVGALRLRSPRPPQPWTGTRDATVAGAASVQTPGGRHAPGNRLSYTSSPSRCRRR